MAKSNAWEISSFNKTGINEGGDEMIPLNLIRSRAKANEVTRNIQKANRKDDWKRNG